MNDGNMYDVIIVGGSYAGLSAAMSLGRSMRKTLVIDSGRPCNRQTPHSHNFLTQDGVAPGDISHIARNQVEQYPTVTFYDGLAIHGRKVGGLFEVDTQGGEMFRGKKLIFTTGIKDILPEIEGFSACWGRTIVHCPYCHGYEFRGQKTGILANGEMAYHLASLVHNLTRNLTLVTNGEAHFSDLQRSILEKHDIRILEFKIQKIDQEEGRIQQVIFDKGHKLTLDVLYGHVPFSQHCGIPVSLGCQLTESGHIATNEFHETNIEGVYAAGDCASPLRSVANAVAGGNFLGAFINKKLVDEQF